MIGDCRPAIGELSIGNCGLACRERQRPNRQSTIVGSSIGSRQSVIAS
jgi:hypothetical protein